MLMSMPCWHCCTPIAIAMWWSPLSSASAHTVATEALARLAREANPGQLLIVGAPIAVGTALYNCAVCINQGRLVGIVPKLYLPNYNEFYEARYFAHGRATLPSSLKINDADVPFGRDLLFSHGNGLSKAVVHVEICEDFWVPIPPSSLAACAGANVLCNLSASPETINKAHQRRSLVVSQSNRCQSAYLYASAGPTESTADLVFGGHGLIAEGGSLLVESSRVGDGTQTARDARLVKTDIDIERLNSDRRTMTTFVAGQAHTAAQGYREIALTLQADAGSPPALVRKYSAHPFVPSNAETLAERCADVFGIQTMGLAKRIKLLGDQPQLVIGISGGLDSTLALIVAARTCDYLGLPRTCIRGVTMPGFGTTQHTLGNSRNLMSQLNITASELDIRAACLLEYQELASTTGYLVFDQLDPRSFSDVAAFVQALTSVPEEKRNDLVFENVQARRRTELLMNMGFVLGTGDMSEAWLGWCTYNADQQSMYNVNCSIPKTLVRFLVQFVAEHEFDGATRETLMSVATTDISPELLPPTADGNVSQNTEDAVGPYELHDFFMFHLARFGFSPDKVLFLAQQAHGWSRQYTEEELRHWMAVNLRRFFSQQYKRDNVPNGPKVGSLSLSPRGDWRMPSDASAAAWLKTVT